MTSICYMSDLHLEMCEPVRDPFDDSDMLVLAGDIWGAPHLSPRRTDADARKRRRLAERLAAEAVERYDGRVVYVPGNHEYYGGEVSQCDDWLDAFAARFGITRLRAGQAVEIAGLRIVGDTLWSDFDRGSAQAMEIIGQSMNDYHHMITAPDGGYWTPEHAFEHHHDALAKLTASLAESDAPTVVVTHHCPSWRCHNTARYGPEMAPGYCTDLESLIIDNPQIRYWFCGHTHERGLIGIGETMIAMNARGYDFGRRHPYTDARALEWRPRSVRVDIQR